MTDLISQLADSLIALINASPRSPRKDEIEGLLRLKIGPLIQAGDEFCASLDVECEGTITFTGSGAWTTPADWNAGDTLVFTTGAAQPDYLVSQEELVKAADQICAAQQGCVHQWGLHYSLETGEFSTVCCSLCGATKP